MIEKIIKRDGRVVDFDVSKIANAIWKAMQAVGEKDKSLSESLAKKVVEKLESKLSPNQIPTVEQVQDIVEETLIEAGLSKVAKAYILYREKRAQIRKEKMQILNKDYIDEVDKAFDINALRVLASRYLNKDESGRVVESPKQLFQRVAIHVTLPSLLYDERVFSKKSSLQKESKIKIQDYLGKARIGKYFLNIYHLEALERLHKRMNKEKLMKKDFSEILNMLTKDEFKDYEKEVDEYYNLMVSRKFMPNTPALVNFGNPLGMGMACFVLGMEDSLLSIMETLKNAAIIFQSGGGCGYNFSTLRPEGDFVRSTHGVSSGPIAFMTLFDKMTDVIKQGGVRRGANMGILNSDHPDIEKFVVAKKGNLQLTNFNISVFLKEDFWEYYKENKPYPLINPRNKQIVKYINPKNFFDLIVYQGWESAEPGLLFDDNINRYNPFLKALGKIESTNPCGEVLLYPNESCDLGSINLWAFVEEEYDGEKRVVKINWEDLEKTVRLAVRFLDNILDINKYPLKKIEERTLKTRKIGLGVMGLADTLFELELPYDSKEGLDFMERIMEFINYYSKLESIEIAKKRGSFPYFNKSFYKNGNLPFRGFYEKESWHFDWEKVSQDIKKYGLRNAYTTVIAPTGSISMIAGCSAGIEPVYSLVYEKKVTIGSFYYVNPVFEKFMEREGLFDDNLIKDVVRNNGSIKNIPYIPQRYKNVFKTAKDISGKDHVKALASIQKWVDSSVSKTINFPEDVSIEEMKETYLLAHELGCKGLTVYREKSISGVYTVPTEEKEEKKVMTSLKDEKVKGPSIYKEITPSFDTREDYITVSEKCPQCGTPLIVKEGCKICPNCGWSACSL
ncbi:adenosylcobalamin-dependent ribonucleoside-diphosphate reductase [Sulfurihydrogenibium azorense]|uniref:adenosylcobalamin-dependent ribonucleoside-diphosphate reductase n=2 Tax=Sulfurihydrogenibium azorense TaxID=309806 RepID=UPI00391D80F0